MFGKQMRLITLLSFEVKVDLSWLFLALLVTWSLARGFFPLMHEGLSETTYWGMGIAGIVGLVVSLVLHELAHSVVARRYGLPIEGITLFIFGGVAQMEQEPANPKVEFRMAIAGPIASLLLATAFYGLAGLAENLDLPVPVIGVATYLGFINTLLAVFNLVPGFPLDGGRVLRSALWQWKGDLRWATRVAAGVGEGFGILLIALGVLNVVTGNFVGGMWWFLIGLFLRGAASASYVQLMTRRALEGVPVRRYMTRDPVTVPPDLTLRQFLDEHVYEHFHDMFPVTENSRLVGCVSVRQVKSVPRDDWSRVTIGEVAQPPGDANTVEADAGALEALSQMRRNGSSRLMVTERGQLAGIVTLKDMLRQLEFKLELDEIA